MKKERNAQKLEVRSKTKQRMDLSFFLSVCLFPLLVLILVLFPFSAAPPKEKRHDSKQKQNGSTRRRAGRTLHGIPSVVEAAAAAAGAAKRRRTREREREKRQQSGHKTRYQTRDDFFKVLTTSAATL
jgi:hypothetical protein